MSETYFRPFIDEYGIHVPEYTGIRNYLVGEFKRIFGSDLYLGEDTQDYQMLSLFADCYDDICSLAVESYNNRNPNYARGRSLDLCLPLNGIRRLGATYSTVELTIQGMEGTVVRANSAAIDINNNRWLTDVDVTIDASGEVTVNATAEFAGEISASANSINNIGTPTAGWVSVTNANEAIEGRNMETDAEVRERRSVSASKTAVGVLLALKGALLEVEGVKKVSVYENSSTTVDSRGIAAHSIAVVVDGGDNQNVARTIYDKKAPGCGMHGTTTEGILDNLGNTINIIFSRPVEKTVLVNISLKQLEGYSSAAADNTKNAIVEYIDGLAIGEKLQVGFLYGIVLSADENEKPSYAPISITAGFDGGTPSSDEVSAAYNELLVCSADNITITTTT